MKDVNLVGVPRTIQVLVGSGAGGNITVPLTPPTGQIYIVKYLTAYHSDATGARTIVWNFTDAISGVTVQGPDGSVAANIRYPFPFATYVPGPLIVSPGGAGINAVMLAVAAAKNCIVEALVHIVFGAAPIV